MKEIRLIDTPNNLVKRYATYVLYDAATAKVLHVGAVKLDRLFMLSDVRSKLDKDRPVHLHVLDVCENQGEAIRLQAKRIKELDAPIIPRGRSKKIKCITTGEVFNSSKEAAFIKGISASNLSNHLNGRHGFRSVKGEVYERCN